MSVRDTLSTIGEIAWATAWGIRHYPEIAAHTNARRACSDCSDLSDNPNDVCSTHHEEWEHLIENGPYTNNPFS